MVSWWPGGHQVDEFAEGLRQGQSWVKAAEDSEGGGLWERVPGRTAWVWWAMDDYTRDTSGRLCAGCWVRTRGGCGDVMGCNGWQCLGWRQIGECVVGGWWGDGCRWWTERRVARTRDGLTCQMGGCAAEDGVAGGMGGAGRRGVPSDGGARAAYLACGHDDVRLTLLMTRAYSLRALRSPILVVSSLLLGSWYSSCSPGTTKPWAARGGRLQGLGCPGATGSRPEGTAPLPGPARASLLALGPEPRPSSYLPGS